jgi:cytochrome b
VGHNPAGAWNIVAILALLAILIALGLFSPDREGLDPGPLSAALAVSQARLARRLHGLAFDGLLGLVTLHLTAIAGHLAKGDNLVGPMLTGRKRLAPGTREPAPAPVWSAAVGLILAVATYLALARLDGA